MNEIVDRQGASVNGDYSILVSYTSINYEIEANENLIKALKYVLLEADVFKWY